MNDSLGNEKSPLEQWILGSQSGDEESLNRLAEYLLPKAFEIANRKMGSLSPVDDFEDVAVSAVKSVCLRFREGQSEFLGERELGGLLQQFVNGKIRTRRKYHYAEKRNVKLNASNEGVSRDDGSGGQSPIQRHAIEDAKSVWLDEHSISLPLPEQAYLASMVDGLGTDVQGLFSELVKRLGENPRKVLMLITTGSMSNRQLAEAMDCAPASIERYRKAIRRKLEEIVNE
ncbi:RNA polymerase sigma factor [Mariniblastus fucicola]|uniref:RNA polymerase sigma factor n=1 Tax=Mariniblastus fucicola TaxID=980251 RepID=A0A5B9P6I8_9BACT|nr:hypothetical protein [Mariniblastus fucicola]QEG22207.1 hypothetical protein MFFC18_20680 [Mariniblastus fucicola]